MNISSAVNKSNGAVKGSSGLNLVAAAWLIISPFVLTFNQVPSAMWNNIICGTVIALIAVIRLNATDQPNWSWANLLIGAWLLISPWVLGFRENGTESLAFNSELVWNNVITGAVVAFLAILSMTGAHVVPRSEND